MSEDQLKAFTAAIKSDNSLQSKLKEAKDVDSIVSIAKEAGFEIDANEINNAKAELSEEDLEYVAGGKGGGERAQTSTACGGCPTP